MLAEKTEKSAGGTEMTAPAHLLSRKLAGLAKE